MKRLGILFGCILILIGLFDTAKKINHYKKELSKAHATILQLKIDLAAQKTETNIYKSWVEAIDPKFATREFSVYKNGDIKYVYFNQKEWIRNGLLCWIGKHYPLVKGKLQIQIVDACMKNPFSFVLLAIAAQESSFRPKCVSKAGAIGLCQIMPLWIPELQRQRIIKTKADLFKIENNIKAAGFILTKYISPSDKSVEKAIGRYAGRRDGKYIKDVLAKIGSIVCELRYIY